MLTQRIFFGAILIAVLALLLYGDHWLSQSPPEGFASAWRSVTGVARCEGLIVTAIVALLVVLGTLELRRLLVAAGHSPLKCWPVLVNVGLIAMPFIAGNDLKHDEIPRDALDGFGTVTMLAIGLAGSAFWVARRKRTEGAIAAVATTLLMILYLGLLPQFLVRLRVFGTSAGIWLLLYFIATVKICDIGAYFTGYAVGRHKMIAWLSPKKTWEGLAGGVAASIGVALLVPWVFGHWDIGGEAVSALMPAGWNAVLFGLCMALIGQGGDLFESLIKRDAQMKDSANAIPAFGGVLDVLDSPLLAAPFACWMLL